VNVLDREIAIASNDVKTLIDKPRDVSALELEATSKSSAAKIRFDRIEDEYP
jgi:hypothetical protein